MYCKLLLISVLVVTLVFGQADLQTQYCTLKSGTTAEIIASLGSGSTRSQTEILLRAQSFLSGTKTVSLAYIQDKTDLRIEETDENLTIITHTDGTTNPLVYIDSRNQYILAKEVTNQTTGTFDYSLFTATLGSANTMSKLSFSSLTAIDGSDISSLKMKKIIQISSNWIYVVMSSSTRTSVFKVNTASAEAMTLVSDLTTDSSLDIIGGNLQHLYDANSNTFYEASSTEPVTYTSTTLISLGFPTNLTPNQFQVTELNGLIIVSFQWSGSTVVLPIDSQELSPFKAGTITGSGVTYTDNYKNFIALTDTELAWYRVTDTGYEAARLLTSSLTATEQAAILALFTQAHSVTFDGSYAIILSQNPTSTKGSISTVKLDLTAAKQFTIINQYTNSWNMDDTLVSSLLTTQTSVKQYLTSYSCNCVSEKIESFVCYSNGMKCVTVSSPERESCNKTA